MTHNEMQQMLIIAEKNAAHSESIAISLKALAEGVNGIKQDSWKLKWFVGIVSIAIIVVTSFVTVVARGIDNRSLFENNIKKVIAEYDRETRGTTQDNKKTMPAMQRDSHY